MESVPHRKEIFSCNKFVFLEIGEGHTGKAETTIHFRCQPDHMYSIVLFDGGHCGCDNVKTLGVIVFL